jgi:hypothetical protein
MSRVDEVFQCTQGTVYTNGSHNASLKSWFGNTVYEHNATGNPNPYQVEHDELFASIRKGNVISDTENGAKSTLTAIMGRMATYTGQVITWDQVMKSKELLVKDDISWSNNPPVMPDEEGRYPVPVPGITAIV